MSAHVITRPWLMGSTGPRLTNRHQADNFVLEAEQRGIAVDETVLAAAAADPKVAGKVKWLRGICAGTGRVRPRYGVVASTGRLASSSPNLTGMPHGLAAALVPDPGWVFTSVEALRLEPAALASIAKDKALGTHLGTGDPFAAIADELGLDREEAKVLVFSAVYGDLGIAARRVATPERLAEITEAFRERFAATSDFVGETRNVDASRRVMRLASLAHAEALGAAHVAAIVSDVETYAVGLRHDCAVFTHPEGTHLDDSVVDAYRAAITARVRPVEVITTTASSFAGI